MSAGSGEQPLSLVVHIVDSWIISPGNSIRCILRLESRGGVRSFPKCDIPLPSGVWQLDSGMVTSDFGHLGLDERRFLFRLREAHVLVAEIVSRLGRHRST